MKTKTKRYLRMLSVFVGASLLFLLLLGGVRNIIVNAQHIQITQRIKETDTSTGPILRIPQNTIAYAGEPVSLTVIFTSNDHAIASTVFSLNYDQTCLHFDPTDADGDQIPDAVMLDIPGGFNGSVTFSGTDTDGELDFFISDLFPPLSSLPNGTLATVRLMSTCQPISETITATVGFSQDPLASFGDTAGQSIAGATYAGVVEIIARSPTLSIAKDISAQAGTPASVPIRFRGDNYAIATTAFSVDYDQACLDFDPVDRDADGIPDAVDFHVTGAFNAFVTFDKTDTDGELDFFIGDIFPPLASLPDGTLATVTFTPTCSPSPENIITATVGFSQDPTASFGSVDGQSVAGTTINSYLEIMPTTHLTAGVTLSPDHRRTAIPGSTLLYTHTLTNNGNVTDTFDLTLSTGWGLLVSQTPVTLSQEVTTTVHVRMTIPTDAVSGTIDTTRITATSQLDPDVSASAVDTTTVVSAPVVEQAGVEFGPKYNVALQAGEAITYMHTLTNTGTTTDTFDLVAVGWGNLLTPTPITLSHAATATLPLHVVVPTDAVSGTINVTHITATSRLDPDVTATISNTITVVQVDYQVYLPLTLKKH